MYHVDFKNRLLGITQGPGIVGNPSVLANVGSVKTDGVEAAITWRPMTNFSWFTSVAWNDSQYADDYTTTSTSGAQTVVPVAGKQVTDTPEVLVKSEVSYDNGAFFVRANANFTDERFYTYLNEGGVDSYALLNVGVGYSLQTVRSGQGARAAGRRDEPHGRGVLQHDRLERLRELRPERHDADAAARRAAAVLRLDQSAVLTTHGRACPRRDRSFRASALA